MDNNAFERSMINFVNNNAKTAYNERADQFYRDLKKWNERRRAEKIRAIIELMFWVLGFCLIVVAFCAMSYLEKINPMLSGVVQAVFGFATGIRVCALAKVI